jgi:beta-glucosidase
VGNSTNNSRLGIFGLHLQDGPAGVADGVQAVTALPAPILLAATWDTSLARQYGAVIGAEARGKGVHVSLGPMINPVRVPQGGLSFETFVQIFPELSIHPAATNTMILSWPMSWGVRNYCKTRG